MDSQTATLIINGLLVLVSIFGGMWLRNMDASVKESRVEQSKLTDRINQGEQRLHDKFHGYVPKDEFKDFRDEQRSNFDKLFQRLDSLRDQVSTKADRE